MFSSIRNFFSRFYTFNEVFRLTFMLGLIALLFYPDYGGMKTMSYVLAVMLAIIFIAHIVRKYCLFNYINMKDLADSALQTRNTSAAIVFASVCAVIMMCIHTAAQFFTR